MATLAAVQLYQDAPTIALVDEPQEVERLHQPPEFLERASLAEASNMRMKATRVAARRSSGSLTTACALATDANRASDAALPGGAGSAARRRAPG